MFCRLALALIASLAATRLAGDTPTARSVPPLADLRELLKRNVQDIAESELDAVAAQALLDRVQGRILASGESVNEESEAPAIAEKRVFEPGCLYVRVGQVSLGLAPQLAAVLRDTNLVARASGLVLDLRFAGGTDYAGAANTANLFLAEDRPLLDWGEGTVRSTPKTNAWSLPVTVLVNPETRGAAEALAASLRSSQVALLIGNRTAGKAAVFREIPLSDGRRLRLAAARVRAGGDTPLGPAGLQPDIAVRVPIQSEQAYLADPYTNVVARLDLPGGGQSAGPAESSRRRITEADLVRQHRSALDGTPETTTNAPAGGADSARIIRDPVLGRAIDLIKNLSILQPAKS